MNKAYFALVALLILVTVGIGGFAIYRTVQNQNSQTGYLSQPSLTSPKKITVNDTKPQTNTPVDSKPVSNNLKLSLTSPKDGQQFTSAKIVVSGETEPNADVSINDLEVKANSAGKFQTTLTLDDGDNPIYIFASDQDGNFAEWQGSVTYAPAQ
jgi:hypothetical protein